MSSYAHTLQQLRGCNEVFGAESLAESSEYRLKQLNCVIPTMEIEVVGGEVVRDPYLKREGSNRVRFFQCFVERGLHRRTLTGSKKD